MPPASWLWRALGVVLAVLVVVFGGTAILISVREAPSSPQASELRSARIRAPEGLPFTETPLPTVPPTTLPPPAPPEPEAEPDPAPAPAPAAGGSRQQSSAAPAPAPAPDPAPPPSAGPCQNLGGGALVAAHSSVKPYSGDGALSASATGWALTLCNAHVGDGIYHSDQAAGENLAWVYSSGGCVNNASMVLQAWLASPAHRANIDRFSVVGAGVACDGSNTYFVAQYR